MTEIPYSMEEVELDRNLLRANHAVEQMRLEKKYAALHTQYAEQKIQLDRAKEQLYHLSDMQNRCKELEDQFLNTKDALEIEKQLMLKIEQSSDQGFDDIRHIMLENNRAERSDKKYEETIETMRSEIETLQNQIKANIELQETDSSNDQAINELRDELRKLAVTITAQTATKEGENSLIPNLVKNAGDDDSLAAQIKEKINTAPKTNEKKPQRKKSRKKTVTS